MSQLFVKTSGIGEPLIVLHGWGMNSAVWERIQITLESQFSVRWVDLPGHGQNSELLARSLDEIVDYVLALVSKKAHFMGWSLGGLIIQALAEKSPESIQSMTLVASTPRFSQTDDWTHAMSKEVLKSFSQRLEVDRDTTLKKFIALQFMGVRGARDIQNELTSSIIQGGNLHSRAERDNIGTNQRQLKEKIKLYKTAEKGGGVLNSASTRDSALRLGMEILIHSDFRQKTHNIPQHWVLAERDRLIPKEVINDLKLIRPDDQITLLENAGHAPFMTHPNEFLDAISPFIKSHLIGKQDKKTQENIKHVR